MSRKWAVLGLYLVVISVLPNACSPFLGAGEAGKGMLEGKVSVGTLTPVQQVGVPEPTPAPEVYAERQVVVYSQDGKKEIARVQIGADGSYRVGLAPGAYLVDINHLGIDSSKDLPVVVQINRDETTRLDIDIDTGIR